MTLRRGLKGWIFVAAVFLASSQLALAGDGRPDDLPPRLPDSLLQLPAQQEPVPTNAPTRAQPTNTQVVVLRTGGVLQGTVAQQGKFFLITTWDSEIRIRVRDAEIVCRNLEDAYAKKREAILADSATEHIVLAEWCLRHRLNQFAARELLDARRLEPRHARLEAAARRLAWATRPRPPIAKKGTSPSGIVQAAYSEPAASNSPETVSGGKSTHLTEEAMEMFTNSIQPLLLNSCTAGGCHQVGGSEQFQLDRFALQRRAGRPTTLQNLEATIAWVDVDTPSASRLLIEANRAHGGKKMPPLAGRRAALYQKLIVWVNQVADERGDGGTLSNQAASYRLSNDASPTTTGYSYCTEDPVPFLPLEIGGENLDARLFESADRPIQRGASLQRWEPRDAFDPEIFNRNIQESH